MLVLTTPVNVLTHTNHATVSPSASNNARLLAERYVPIQTVGVGSTASVTLALDAVTHGKVALKTVSKTKMSRRKVMQEINVQASVSQHPYIATLHDAIETDDAYTLVEEYMPNGDLFDVIKPDLGMPEENAMQYARQLISAIEYMHRCRTAHRDIKPENVCLAADNTSRLIDFGHAAFLQDCKQDDYIGTVPYMAYELLADNANGGGPIDFRQTDMWAFGATLFVMCTGKFPWREATLTDKEFAHFAAGGAGPCHRARWAAFSPALNTLLRHTMCIDTHRRWTATQARAFIEEHWGDGRASHLAVTQPLGCTAHGSPRLSLVSTPPPEYMRTLTPSSGPVSPHLTTHSSSHNPFAWASNLWRPHATHA